MKKLLIALFAAALTITSCVKGDKGDTGPAGTNGTNGTNGINGNNNVHSGYITLYPSNWASGTPAGFYYVDVTYAGITSEVISYGSVQVFMEGNTGNWIALPYTIYNNPSVSLVMGYTVSVGICRIWAQNLAGGSITFNTNRYKVVAITGAEKQAHPDTDWTNYKEVMQAIGEPVNTTL